MTKAQTAQRRSVPTNITMEETRETEATLARTLKMLRNMDGYTQDEVARAIGTSVTNISHWETGLKVPRPEWLTALAKLYDVEVGNLFGVKVEKKKGKRKTEVTGLRRS